MTKTVETRAASAIRELSIDELGLAAGGASQFIASIAAAAINVVDPSAHCTAANHNVVCENPPQTPK